MYYVLVALIFSVAGVLLGYIIKGKTLSRDRIAAVMLRYTTLTPKSKDLVDGYISARMANDERTTYSERKK